MLIDHEQERRRARLQSCTQAAIDRANKRSFRGRVDRALVRARLVESLAQAGVMFGDDVFDSITDGIMTRRRVDAATVIPWHGDTTNPPGRAQAEG